MTTTHNIKICVFHPGLINTPVLIHFLYSSRHDRSFSSQPFKARRKVLNNFNSIQFNLNSMTGHSTTLHYESEFLKRSWNSRSYMLVLSCRIRGSPSSKYKHRPTSTLLHNIRNIRICMEKKNYRFRNLRQSKDFNKNSLPYIKCVLRLSCVVHGPIYGRFMVCTVNGFLSI